MTQRLVWSTLEDGRRWAAGFVAELKRPSVVLLSGPLGAGKTQTVRWLLDELGASGVASPTFAIHNEYKVRDGVADHVDLYRVTSPADLESSGFWDLFSRPDGLVFVEWADRLPSTSWPSDWNHFSIELAVTDGVRLVSIKRP